MIREEIRALALEKLLQVAPDIDPDQLDPAVPVCGQYDSDSMDFLNFTIALGREFQMDIPERDYAELQSLDDAVRLSDTEYRQRLVRGVAVSGKCIFFRGSFKVICRY